MRTNGPTMSFKRFEGVHVSFAFIDKNAGKNRPALVLSNEFAFNALSGYAVRAMITTAEHSEWPLDSVLQSLTAAGLPGPIKVRFKLFTLDHHLILGRLGQLATDDAGRVQLALASLLPE